MPHLACRRRNACRDCQSVIYRNDAADLLLNAAHVAGIGFEGYGALIVTGTALAVAPSRSATLSAMKQARAAGVPVILDVDYRPYSWASAADAAATCRMAAEASDMVVGNDVEWDVMAGGSGGLAYAVQLAGARAAVYKMGKGLDQPCRRGALRNTHLSRHRAEADGRRRRLHGGPRDRTCRSASICRAVTVRRGTAAAAIVVTRVGCAPASPTAPRNSITSCATTRCPRDPEENAHAHSAS